MSQSRVTYLAGVPVLPSPDVVRAVEFYRDVLGFTVAALTDEPYAVLKRDQVTIHLWQCDDPDLPTHTGCRIVISGIKALYEELRPKGVVHPNAPLEEQPWGALEFAIGDLDSNLITFVELIGQKSNCD